MIFDIGWIEILVIAVMAIVVVGPKDLPKMMRILGQWVAKARGLAREFQKSIDDLVRESELDDLKKEVEELRKLNPIEDVKKALDPTQDLRALDEGLKADLGDVMTELDEKPRADGPSEPDAIDADLSTAQTAQEEARETFREENIETSGEGALKP